MNVERLAVPFEWILAALEEAVIATDLEGAVQYWNAAAERLYGWTALEAVDRNIAELTVPEEVSALADDVMATLRTGARWSGEFTVRRRDGSRFAARVTDVPVFDEAGALVGVVGLSTDVSGSREEADLRSALAAARVGTWRRRMPGAYEWDAVTEALHGLPPGSFAGTIEAWLAAIHPADRQRVMAHRRNEAIEYRTVNGDRWLETRGRGSVGIVLDVTDRKRAEATLREDAQAIETLHHIGSALVAELDLARVIEAVTDAATLLTGAQWGAFDGVGQSYATGADKPTRSHLVVPVVSGTGKVHGRLSFGHEEAGVFTEREERLAVGMAAQAAVAIDNATLYHAEQEHRLSAERSAARLSQLNAMATRLADARSVDDAAAVIVSVAAEALGACKAVVCGRSEDGGSLVVLEATGGVSSLPEQWRTVPLSAPLPIVDAFCNGQLVLLPTVVERDRRYPVLAAASAIGRSFAAVPLEVEGESCGVLALSFLDERAFTDEECDFMVALGLQAGQALGRAQLADAERRAARTLQESLLPPGRLAVPGFEVAARYHAFGPATEVGGDFFDAFPSGDGFAVVMGDVRGKGIQSAAVTALARYTLRAAAQLGQGPADAVRLVNRAIHDQGDPERFCTVVEVVVRPAAEAGGFEVTVVCGGHPLPLLVSGVGAREGGRVRPIGRYGTVVGLFEDPELHEVRERMAPGDVLVLFTDGVLEARSPDGRFDPDLLPSVLRQVAGAGAAVSAEDVASAIERAVLRFEGGMPRDDMAVVVLKSVAP